MIYGNRNVITASLTRPYSENGEFRPHRKIITQKSISILYFPPQVLKIFSVPIIFSRSNILSYEFITPKSACIRRLSTLLFYRRKNIP
jgi:hypothetical protein